MSAPLSLYAQSSLQSTLLPPPKLFLPLFEALCQLHRKSMPFSLWAQLRMVLAVSHIDTGESFQAPRAHNSPFLKFKRRFFKSRARDLDEEAEYVLEDNPAWIAAILEPQAEIIAEGTEDKQRFVLLPEEI